MSRKKNEQHKLIDRYLLGMASEEEVDELNFDLEASPDLRQAYYEAIRFDVNLREEAFEIGERKSVTHTRISYKMRALAAVVIGFLGLITWHSFFSRPMIATLVSSEHASWESSLPTFPNAQLTAGFLKLKSGVATIQFRSGAKVTIEAPAHFVLESPMKGRLLAGAAVIDVPDSAIGFVIETPDGYAVDHGTRFAVSVNENSRKSEFEVLSGEISVHLPESKEEMRLKEKDTVLVDSAGITLIQNPNAETSISHQPTEWRIGTKGNENSVIQSNQRDEFLHPTFLMVKRCEKLPSYSRRMIFAFDVSAVKKDKLTSARIRLNLVPCGIGYAARLPEVNTFSLYGIRNKSKQHWGDSDLQWESLPNLRNAVLLGTFDVPRGKSTGNFGIETAELVDFLKNNSTESLSFILTRNSDENEGNGLVHAFASSQHPEASGPTLEVSYH